MDIIWVHIDALSLRHPVFAEAGEDARAIFFWDADDMARRGWSLKRCLFVYETVAEMGIEVIAGSAVDVLADLQPDRLFVAETPDPDINAVLDGLSCPVARVTSPQFSDVPPYTDMGRFFRYWNQAKRSVMIKTAEQST